MREEGFADDGLFPKMAEFFLPLTISEQELCIERELDQQRRQTLMKNHEQLVKNINKKSTEYDDQDRVFWTYDEKITKLQKLLNDARERHSQERSTVAGRTNDGQNQQQQAQALQQLDRKWHQEEAELVREINEIKKLKNDLEKFINILGKGLEEDKTRLETIKTELAASPKYVDKNLIKPARGLIMYGPPGTFSYIDSKLFLNCLLFCSKKRYRKIRNYE
jgi:chromosome segregation ATPase